MKDRAYLICIEYVGRGINAGSCSVPELRFRVFGPYEKMKDVLAVWASPLCSYSAMPRSNPATLCTYYCSCLWLIES